MKTHMSHSPDETRSIGKEIGHGLQRGDVVCIFGELGSGKTCLVQGIALGLGVDEKEYVRSPTFTIHLTYQGRCLLHHFDFYRLSETGEIEELGLEEFFNGDNVCLVEWPDRLKYLLPENRIEIHMQEISENERKVMVQHGH